MSTEEEFARWLRRPEKTFLENLQFALKAWQSAEFTLASKYEVVLSWLAEVGAQQLCHAPQTPIPTTELAELLKLQAQPGLISQQTKSGFVTMWLQLADNWLSTAQHDAQVTRLLPVLLHGLSSYELLQDYYRADNKAQACVYGKLLQLYEKYLQQFAATASSTWLSAQESTFFAAVMTTLSDSAKRATDQRTYDRCYSAHVLQPLVEVLLLLRTHGLCYFEELLALERMLCEQHTETALVHRVVRLPLHVRLLALECAIVNRRGVEGFLKHLIQHNFRKLLGNEKSDGQSPALSLTAAAYTLEILRKHDISLNIKIGDDETALAFLGNQLVSLVQQHKVAHMREVLMLLCAALRLNPLILEQHIFQVTTWLIVAPKSDAPEEQQLFEEYMVLLMDMFRRLSRAEKFVSNLLKSLKEWLQKYKLATAEKARKRLAMLSTLETPSKKLKLNTEDEQAVAAADSDVTHVYLQILFKDCYKPPDSLTSGGTTAASRHAFPELQTAWPSATVGMAFAKVITGLMSKPSLVIWKSLLYALKELLAAQEEQRILDGNAAFQMDLHAALLCQYFAGAKLAEQYDKFGAQVLEQRQLTAAVLGTFGRWLLKREHHQRSMNAFLECCYHVASFELLLGYYRPDGLVDESVDAAALLQQLHGCLSKQEWTLIEQRVLNFGAASCKYLLNRLFLQRTEARLLLSSGTHSSDADDTTVCLQTTLHAPITSANEQLCLLLQRAPNAKWLVAHLTRAEKLEVAKVLHSQTHLFDVCTEDLECVELLALCTYAELARAFASSKSSLMAVIGAQFEALFQPTDDKSHKTQMQQLVAAITIHLDDYNVPQLPQAAAEQALHTLRNLPIGHLRRQSKCQLFALHLAFYRDLKAAQALDLAAAAFDLLTELLHFGQQVPIFKYFSTECILKLFPVESCWEFYEFLFTSVKNEQKFTDRFLLALIQLLQASQHAGKLSEAERRLTLLAIETLSSMSGPSAKRMRKHLDSILDVYAAHVQRHFAKTLGENAKKDKKFVEQTLAGFAPYINMTLNKATAAVKPDEEQQVEATTAVDESLRRMCKVYIGHSMDYRSPHAIHLMQVALNHRQQLHLDQDEIECVLSGYWRQLNADLNAVSETPALHAKSTTETVVKMIIGNKTNEDLLLTLKDIAANVVVGEAKHFLNVTRLLALIAKCPFSTIKGAIFNEQFKPITYEINLRLRKDERQQFVDTQQVLNMLACQLPLVDNKMIPISTDTLDSILAFLIDINIKKFTLTDTNVSSFHALHLAMTELCTALIKQRHLLLMDRVPQFMHIFKDLLQSVVWYKSERQKDAALTPAELDDLAELALKLEALMHIIATHSVGFKRVAPFVLTFVIQLMVSSKRAATLYPKIKTHIESICYDLVGICDHRVGRFILRCSNEAARQVYETLVKDHKKYHKFKGKV